MYTRTTNAMRRALATVRIIHVSQQFRIVEAANDDGTNTVGRHVMPEFGITVPNAKGEPTFIPKGKTYNVGRNWRKRICKAAGLNHVHMERHHGLRNDGRRTFYPACVGA